MGNDLIVQAHSYNDN